MSDIANLSKLGSSSTQYRYEEPSPDILEAFSNRHRGSRQVIGLDCLEFTSLCPVTGQPDYGRIWIDYVPDALCVESKSLKLYLVSYRNHGAFHEDCVNTIADDLVSVLSPLYLRVWGDFNVRGGIAIRPMAIREAPELDSGARDEIAEAMATYDRLAHR